MAKPTLKVYSSGHSTVFLDKCFAQDVREFVNQRNPITTKD